MRELSSHDLTNENLVQKYKYAVYTMWQPSLVLGKLGGALNGPHGSQEPYPNLLALQAY